MPETTTQILQLAIQQHQANQLAQAEAAYQQILNREPDHPDALHLLGLIALQKGRCVEAVDLIQRAIAWKPGWPQAHYNLGLALIARGEVDRAITAYRQAIALNPDFAEAHNSLGNALRQKGEWALARDAYLRAIGLRPNYADAHNNLGNALRDLGHLDQAMAAYRKAISLRPDYPQALNNLGVVLQENEELDEAAAAYQQALLLKPDYAEASNNLGVALAEAGQLDAAVAAHQQAIVLRPRWAEAHHCMGKALVLQGKLDEAISACQSAVALKPGLADAHYSLGKAMIDAGDVDGAMSAFRAAIALRPDNSSFASALLFAMHYHPDCEPRAIAEAHFDWSRRFAEPLEKLIQPEMKNHDRVRIGYVSPDFRNHPVGRFVLPILEHHDHQAFEIFCYNDAAGPDAMTARLRSHADHWRETRRLKHEQLAEQIREDDIDILIDLTGHTTGSRLLMFARKPALVQVSYLGYPGTTGMKEIDYRLTDSVADPPGLTDPYYSETLIQLPGINWCFSEHEPAPEIGPSPLSLNGHVTFGSFNHFARVTDTMLRTWARILLEIPDSRLLLKAAAFVSERARHRANGCFEALGIDRRRISLLGPQPDHATHLATYNQIDITLDTFPYHGTTTTCDALWMGVPVITLAGQAHASRVGVSLLSGIGLPGLIATSIEDYIRVAVTLALDRDRLIKMRSDLREQMRQSPLMDASVFTRDIEAAYQKMLADRAKT